ncbi:hypothetical protein HOL34_02385 [bacterium]|nr:hypothetical protein [bacterium]
MQNGTQKKQCPTKLDSATTYGNCASSTQAEQKKKTSKAKIKSPMSQHGK